MRQGEGDVAWSGSLLVHHTVRQCECAKAKVILPGVAPCLYIIQRGNVNRQVDMA